MNNDEVDAGGNHSDAGSGATAALSSSPIQFKDYSSQPGPNKIINDFITTPSHHHNNHHKAVPGGENKPGALDAQHRPEAKLHHHRPQHAKTLMRWSVRKPGSDRSKAVSGTLPPRAVPVVDELVGPTSYNHERLEHAKAIPKSPIISRFRNNDVSGGKVSPVNVSPAVSVAPVVAETTADIGVERVSSHDVVNDAFFNAKSHEQPIVKHKAHKKSHGWKRFVRIVLTIVIVVGLLATAVWVGYTRVPGVGTRIASIRSGINVTAPGFTPAGFAYKAPVKYYKNLATITYSSKASNQTYYVAEQATNWDNQAVLNNVVLINNYAYSTVKQDGLVIYVYGPSNASWVSGALLYTIYGNAKLGSTQLAHIATSIN